MLKFKRSRTYKEIKAQCKAQGLVLNDVLYRIQADDYIVVNGGGCQVLFNTFNGRFHGSFRIGNKGPYTKFSSSSTHFENRPWFIGLMNFFYTNDPLPRSKK